jgi:hypothetical protein
MAYRVMEAVKPVPGETHDNEDIGCILTLLALSYLCHGPHGAAGAARLFGEYARRAEAMAQEADETAALAAMGLLEPDPDARPDLDRRRDQPEEDSHG